jgi:hypothetical protein
LKQNVRQLKEVPYHVDFVPQPENKTKRPWDYKSKGKHGF